MEHWTDSEHDWSASGEDYMFSDQKGQETGKEEDLAEEMCVWNPMEDEDWSKDLKTLFEEGSKGDATNA